MDIGKKMMSEKVRGKQHIFLIKMGLHRYYRWDWNINKKKKFLWVYVVEIDVQIVKTEAWQHLAPMADNISVDGVPLTPSNFKVFE